jgi:hypothetical protein
MASTAGFARDQVVLYINSGGERPKVATQLSSRRLSARVAGVVGTVGTLGGLWARTRQTGLPDAADSRTSIGRREFALWIGASGISAAALLIGFPPLRDAVAGPAVGAAKKRTPAAEEYGLSRVRKVLNDTQLELYHSMPGARGPGELRTINRGVQAPQRVLKLDNEWVWITTSFKVFYSREGDRKHFETTALLRSATLTGQPIIDWHATPIALMGRWNNAVSSENLRLIHEPIRD